VVIIDRFNFTRLAATTASFGDFSTPVVVGNCAYIGRQGIGTDEDAGIFVVKLDDYSFDRAHDGRGDGEADTLFIDGGELAATGKSGAFFTTERAVGSGCGLSAPRVAGPRRTVWTLTVAAPTPAGVVVGDVFGTLWLSHIR
jgi:hypothetical protein